jgi:putative two-component system response regulator
VDHTPFSQARILIVDDQLANVRVLQRLLAHAGYTDTLATTDSSDVVRLCREAEPDLVMLDLHMPAPDGFRIPELLGSLTAGRAHLPVLVITADASAATRRRALSLGARDFVGIPFDPTEVQLRVANLLETRRLHLELQGQNEALAERVRERTLELEDARFEVLDRLTLAAEYRDDDTQEHARRIGRTSGLIADRLGLDAETRELLVRAAPLHDIGKIGIPDAILLKPGRLTAEEFEVMKRHALIGAELLAGGRSPVLQSAEEIALTHHERWDGTGYPDGLAADLIPLAGRIVAVADVFDALTHARPYKQAWPIDRAVREICDGSGRQFDPAAIEAFMTLDHPALVMPIAAATHPHGRVTRAVPVAHVAAQAR